MELKKPIEVKASHLALSRGSEPSYFFHVRSMCSLCSKAEHILVNSCSLTVVFYKDFGRYDMETPSGCSVWPSTRIRR